MAQRFFWLLMILALLGASAAHAQNPLMVAPNDPQLADQWAVERIGLACAWQHTTGSPNVTVAVVDSGVDMSHPDLQDALRDDGFNAIDGSNDPRDENGHGTQVAGIIAATINNGEGVAGVAGGGTRILPIRVMGADGSGSTADIAAGVRYAISKKVQVINMSLGSLLPLDSDEIVAAIKEAAEANILVVVAAGNSYVPLPNFSFDVNQYAMIIAATDPDDHKTDFSQYGSWITLSSPGQEILSTMPTYEVFLTSSALPPEQRFRQNYDTMSGTSQATPIVSGVAALVFAEHPDWTAQQVRAELQKTAFDIKAQNPAKKFGPITYFDPANLGAGRIDACAALGGPLDARSAGASSGGASKRPLWLWLTLGGAGLLLIALALLLLRRRRQAPALVPPPPVRAPNETATFMSAGAAVPQPGGPQRQRAPNETATFMSAGAAVPQPDVRTPPPPPPPPPAWGKLTIVAGPDSGRFLLLRGEELIIGREPGVSLQLPDPSISRRHVRLMQRDGQIWIEDLGSSYGTMLNGQRLVGSQPLANNSELLIGQTTLRVEL